MNDQLLERSTPGTGTVSKTGWSNSELFMDFLSNHFKKFVPGNGHVMVLLDGNKSHVAFVRENENVSEREEVVSDEDNVGVVSEGEIGLEKVVHMKRVKGEKKKRNVLSRIISGKTVTEDDVLERVKEHVSKNHRKNASESVKQVVRKARMDLWEVRGREGKRRNKR
ncbi:Hypothetical predicted protein [Mytilus galloprovincialis]|uniref:DDE-1 domain-containing protein n=1 Tax=Mytilus galloprovincialis TaxID=29158 RepID=A0A8B6GPK0_MYTGA|nr:Hypothetical predicted protein [Mytilus galloprovincialis]